MQEGDRSRLLDVNVYGGARGAILDRCLVVAKIRCRRNWVGRGMGREERLVSELTKGRCKTDHETKLKQK